VRKRLAKTVALVTLALLPVVLLHAAWKKRRAAAREPGALDGEPVPADDGLGPGRSDVMPEPSTRETIASQVALEPATPQRRRFSRALALGAAIVLPLAALGVAAAVAYWPSDLPAPLPPPREPVLPDLVMPSLSELYAGTGEESGRDYLYFTATIANGGRGPLLVHAVRAGERGDWRVSQRFQERGGGLTESVTPGEMVWGGHGHEHWHVVLGASYALARADGTILRRYEKVGYCFFDQRAFDLELPAAPTSPRFPKDTCEGEERLELDMGLSVGWSDPYQWTLPDQRLEITGLDDGTYRLLADADPSGWFRETDETNNQTWVDVRLTTSADPPRVELLRVGPHA
jgi:hypothetical protein